MQGNVDMQDLGSLRAAMKAMETQLAELKAQREAAEAEQVPMLPFACSRAVLACFQSQCPAAVRHADICWTCT